MPLPAWSVRSPRLTGDSKMELALGRYACSVDMRRHEYRSNPALRTEWPSRYTRSLQERTTDGQLSSSLPSRRPATNPHTKDAGPRGKARVLQTAMRNRGGQSDIAKPDG